jgi:vancomycin resistance protein VanJ
MTLRTTPTLPSRWLDIFSASYIALLLVWWLLRLVFLDGLWWLALINTFALALFVPGVLLTPLALWSRRYWLLCALVLPVALFVWLFGETLLPPASVGAVDEGRTTITVMSFNVLWSNQEYDRIAEVIATADPDIVGFQELRPEHLPAINARLPGAYPYHASLEQEGLHTVGLLSRFPIESTMLPEDTMLERAIAVRVQVDDHPLTVVVAHFNPTPVGDILHTVFDHRDLNELSTLVSTTFAQRERQTERLLAYLGDLEHPAIVLCDCNANSVSEVYGNLRTDLQDSFVQAGWGLGNTRVEPWFGVPLKRVDYVWHVPELQSLRAWVGSAGGSDHLPVIAELAWR